VAPTTSPAVIHYATYFDRHYLTRGLALYRSLVRHSRPFALWVLCLDKETHRTLSRRPGEREAARRDRSRLL
jgi:hypothetical protein